MASMSDVSRVVNTLVTTIETNFRDFNISEIVKGGSLGHGTGVAGKSDLDLVIYSRSFTGRDVMAQGNDMFQHWLTKLDMFLQVHLGSSYNKTRMTKRSVQFEYKGIEVDLLVSPYYESPHDFYQFLKTIHPNERDRFSVCASKWQVDFFQQQKSKVKEYIRKAKEWRNAVWPKGGSGRGRPSSYLLSLLVVAAYERNPHNVAQGLKDLVGRAQSLDVTWPGECYELRDVSSLLPSRPRIVDPANPANNVWKTGLKSYQRHTPSDYEPGDGYTGSITANIRSISNYI